MRGDFKEGPYELGLPLRCGGFGLVGRTWRRGLGMDHRRESEDTGESWSRGQASGG